MHPLSEEMRRGVHRIAAGAESAVDPTPAGCDLLEVRLAGATADCPAGSPSPDRTAPVRAPRFGQRLVWWE
ncbi:hypothetical protein GCM10009734_62960 [Nonomuraea bangladeshensis]